MTYLEQAAAALRASARKPGYPLPSPIYQAKQRGTALRKLALASRSGA